MPSAASARSVFQSGVSGIGTGSPSVWASLAFSDVSAFIKRSFVRVNMSYVDNRDERFAGERQVKVNVLTNPRQYNVMQNTCDAKY